MPALLTCPHGHQWQPPPGDDPAAEGTLETSCPVCGAAGAYSTAGTGEPTERLDTSPDSPAGEKTVAFVDGVAPSRTEARTTPLPAVPGFELLAEIGRGGMAVVYKARQVGLDRLVALKMIPTGLCTGQEELTRFAQEAEAVAQLQHPHIVPIYNIGEHAGRPYFSMELVGGGSLASRLDSTPQPPAAAARLVERLARAVDAAHRKGVVHRDLKPANVLLAPAEPGQGVTLVTACGPVGPYEPKVADFGLAKRLGEAVGRTRTGAILGTPGYMAPEQTGGRNREVGPAADVWALGALLYELLTGRPPFRAETPLETILLAAQGEPERPSRLRRDLPHDLETVCLKCLEREPGRRYKSALELAEDLGRFVRGEGVRARRAPVWERVARGARRRPAAVLATACLLLGVVTAALFYGPDVYRFAAGQGRLTVETIRPEATLIVQQDGRTVATLDLRSGRTFTLPAGDYDLALADDADGLELDAEHVTLTRNGHATVDVRAEVVGEVARFEGHTGTVRAVVYLPDGNHALSVSGYPEGDKSIIRWDVRTGKEVARWPQPSQVMCVAISPDGQYALTGGIGGIAREEQPPIITLWHLADGVSVRQFRGHTSNIDCLSFAPDGRRFLSGSFDRTIRLWDVATGRELRRFEGHAGGVKGVAFLPDGRRFLSASYDGTLRLWDADSGDELRRFRGHGKGIHALALAPDGRRALSASMDGTLRLWDVEGGRMLRRFRGHTHQVTSVAFSPDGRRALSGSTDRTVRLWDVASGGERRCLEGHSDGVCTVAFSPDGRFALSGGGDRPDDLNKRGQDCALHLWRLPRSARAREAGPATAYEVQSYRGHVGTVNGLALSPGGRRFLTCGADGTVRLWDVGVGKERRRFAGHIGGATGAVFVDGGHRILSGARDGVLRGWDADSGKELARRALQQRAGFVSLGPGGQEVLEVGTDGSLRLCAAESGRELRRFAGPGRDVTWAVFGPDGRRALSGDRGRTLRVWDVASGREVRSLGVPPGGLASAGLSPDGRRVLACAGDNSVRVWDVDSGDEVCRIEGHGGPATYAAFTPDGRHVLSGGADGLILLWEAETGREVACCGEHAGAITGLAACSDGRFLSCGADGTVRLWQVGTPGEPLPPARDPRQETGVVLQALRENAADIRCVVFSPDGRRLLVGTADRVLHFWDVRTGKKIRDFRINFEPTLLAFTPDRSSAVAFGNSSTGALLNMETGKVMGLGMPRGQVASVAFSVDGRFLVGGNQDGSVWIWDRKTHRVRRKLPARKPATIKPKDNPADGPVQPPALARIGGIAVQAVALSADGRFLLAAWADGNVRVWGMVSGRVLRQFRCVGRNGKGLRVAFFADGRRALLAAADGSFPGFHVLDLTAGKVLRTVGGAAEPVPGLFLKPPLPLPGMGWSNDKNAAPAGGLVLTADGRRALSRDGDGVLHFWDLESGLESMQLPRTPAGMPLAPDGRHVVVLDNPRTLQLWRLSD